MTFRSKVWPLVVIVFVVAGILQVVGASALQKPVRQHRLFIDGGIAPASFDDLWNRSTVVVDGTVWRSEPLPEAVGGPPRLPMTRLFIEVRRVFKADTNVPEKGQIIELVVIGAAYDRGEYVDSFADVEFPVLKENEHPILFLKWVEADQAYRLATDTPDSVYRVHEDSVESHGRSAVARSLVSLGYGRLIAWLNSKGGVK